MTSGCWAGVEVIACSTPDDGRETGSHSRHQLDSAIAAQQSAAPAPHSTPIDQRHRRGPHDYEDISSASSSATALPTDVVDIAMTVGIRGTGAPSPMTAAAADARQDADAEDGSGQRDAQERQSPERHSNSVGEGRRQEGDMPSSEELPEGPRLDHAGVMADAEVHHAESVRQAAEARAEGSSHDPQLEDRAIDSAPSAEHVQELHWVATTPAAPVRASSAGVQHRAEQTAGVDANSAVQERGHAEPQQSTAEQQAPGARTSGEDEPAPQDDTQVSVQPKIDTMEQFEFQLPSSLAQRNSGSTEALAALPIGGEQGSAPPGVTLETGNADAAEQLQRIPSFNPQLSRTTGEDQGISIGPPETPITEAAPAHPIGEPTAVHAAAAQIGTAGIGNCNDGNAPSPLASLLLRSDCDADDPPAPAMSPLTISDSRNDAPPFNAEESPSLSGLDSDTMPTPAASNNAPDLESIAVENEQLPPGAEGLPPDHPLLARAQAALRAQLQATRLRLEQELSEKRKALKARLTA